jgi:hypothetical protein
MPVTIQEIGYTASVIITHTSCATIWAGYFEPSNLGIPCISVLRSRGSRHERDAAVTAAVEENN